jgi:nicotinate-nucleotide--dimethylbenzimidazole phosphoribosyltransferase
MSKREQSVRSSVNTVHVFPPISPTDPQVALAARAHIDRLTKPLGSLGRLEHLATHLCSIAGTVPAPIPDRAAVVIFAGDHGVTAEAVTPWPSEVTAQMIANFSSGGAAISVLTRRFNIKLVVVDVGVAGDISTMPGVVHRKVKAGTANLLHEPAMTLDEARAATQVGFDIATELVADGVQLLGTGEMGIGNTTASAAIIASLLGVPAARAVGRGTGITDEMYAHKVSVVGAAVAALGSQATDPWHVLSHVGGLEIAALVGFIIGGASCNVPVVIDGVITLSAALLADRMVENLRPYLIAGHRSTEPSATLALDDLDLDPVHELEMRLGEGSGAATAIPIIQAAAALMAEMATFDSAGVTDKTEI